jgi:hypothetical protein
MAMCKIIGKRTLACNAKATTYPKILDPSTPKVQPPTAQLDSELAANESHVEAEGGWIRDEIQRWRWQRADECELLRIARWMRGLRCRGT